jgi:YD repeat-containing protein
LFRDGDLVGAELSQYGARGRPISLRRYAADGSVVFEEELTYRRDGTLRSVVRCSTTPQSTADSGTGAEPQLDTEPPAAPSAGSEAEPEPAPRDGETGSGTAGGAQSDTEQSPQAETRPEPEAEPDPPAAPARACVSARYAPPGEVGFESIETGSLGLHLRYSGQARPEYIRRERDGGTQEEFFSYRDGELAERRLVTEAGETIYRYEDQRLIERVERRDGRPVRTVTFEYDEQGRRIRRVEQTRRRRIEETWRYRGENASVHERFESGALVLRVERENETSQVRTRYHEGEPIVRETIESGEVVLREIFVDGEVERTERP